MKRYGKFEKRPDETEARQPKMKSLLLQTYVLSVLCLVLCMSMFLGSSYAWFTSEVNNTSNEIYIGTLDVGLYKDSGQGWNNLADSQYTLFNDEFSWGPGQTNVETIQVRNEGDLTFKYALSFTDGAVGEKSDTTVDSLSNYFVVTVDSEDYETLQSYDLDDLLNGTAVLEDVLEAGEDAEYTIALSMKEMAGADATAEETISMTVKLVAYQMTDAATFSNSSAYTPVSNAVELQEVLKDNGSALMVADIAMTAEDDPVKIDGQMLDGGDGVLSHAGSGSAIKISGGTISNLTINGNFSCGAIFSEGLSSDLIVSHCTLSGSYAFDLVSANETDCIMEFTDTNFEGSVSYSNAMKHVTFKDCDFDDAVTPYGDTTLRKCVFEAQTLDLSNLKVGESVVLTECTYGNVSGINATLKATENGIEVECTSCQITIENGLVVAAANP